MKVCATGNKDPFSWFEVPSGHGALVKFCDLPPRLAVLEIRIDKPLSYNYNVNITPLRFEWDKDKSALNQKKHGLSFEEAQTVFLDENALLIHDPDHSEEEDRFILLGLSARFRILVVCHCYRESDEVIRIISARKAVRTEQKRYRER